MGRRMLARMSVIDRLRTWWQGQRAYEPPEGRLARDSVERLTSGGGLQRLPGDGLEPPTEKEGS